MQAHFQKQSDIPEEFLLQFTLTTLLKNHYLQGTRETEQYKAIMYLHTESKLVRVPFQQRTKWHLTRTDQQNGLWLFKISVPKDAVSGRECTKEQKDTMQVYEVL